MAEALPVPVLRITFRIMLTSLKYVLDIKYKLLPYHYSFQRYVVIVIHSSHAARVYMYNGEQVVRT